MSGHTTGNTMTENVPLDAIEDLRQQLEGKDELIAALVAELEQVVEQLDRAKRNGDRPRPGLASAGLPAEAVEEHQQVMADLQRVVQEWEEMQAVGTLGRIESELAELRSMMASSRVVHSDRRSEDYSTDIEGVMSRLSGESSEEPGGAAWEAMKRQMIDGHETSDEDGEVDLTELLDGVEAPTPIDIDAATIDALRRACAERDTYIVHLIRWVRSRRPVVVPDNWDEMPEIPEELQQRVEQLASRLEEQVRLAEVEMSLERARLSREKSQLQAERAVMDRHMKRLGITSLDELEDIAVSSSSSGDRRWMRFLGVNRKS